MIEGHIMNIHEPDICGNLIPSFYSMALLVRTVFQKRYPSFCSIYFGADI